MKNLHTPVIAAILAASVACIATAEVVPNRLFTDHAVLQQGIEIPVWGKAEPGEKITVKFSGEKASTTASEEGEWMVKLKPMKASAKPQKMVISGRENKIEFEDILVGEVWIASGQSNMERQLGPRQGQQPLVGWESEVASANYPKLRQFYVPQVKSPEELDDTEGFWTVCSPDTAQDFTAVGYYFGRDIHKAENVPVGLIHTSWGGTPAEAWTRNEVLQDVEGFEDALEFMELYKQNPEAIKSLIREKQNAWYQSVDPGSSPEDIWTAVDFDCSDWGTMELPKMWEDEEAYSAFNGVFWFRKHFTMPEDWDGAEVELHLGAVDDYDTTWINGEWVGGQSGWDTARNYTISGSKLQAKSDNVIAVRVLDTGGGGGLWGNSEYALQIHYRSTSGETGVIHLSGDWMCKTSVDLADAGWPPVDMSESSSAPSVLYNGMIHPLLPFPIAGVIWYQGEANAYRAEQYQTLFPSMITDWREQWGLGDFPFLFVQIAPHQDMTPEIREAQLISWQNTKNTAMVVTLDIGNAVDIHPTEKEPVGGRLALAARALAYDESIIFSGPVFHSMKIKGDAAILKFIEVGEGLTAPGGTLKGFTIAGEDGVFHPGIATITDNHTVFVSAPR